RSAGAAEGSRSSYRWSPTAEASSGSSRSLASHSSSRSRWKSADTESAAANRTTSIIVASRKGSGANQAPGHEQHVGRPLGQPTVREREVIGVDVALARERDLGRLAVGPFHEADAGAGGKQPFHVRRGAEQVRLHADADVGVLGAHAPGQVERRVDVARLLHVDPQVVSEG